MPSGQERQGAEPREKTPPHPICPTKDIFLGLSGQQEIDLVGYSLHFCYHGVIRANTSRNASEFRSCPSSEAGSTVSKPPVTGWQCCVGQRRLRVAADSPRRGRTLTVSVRDRGWGQTSVFSGQCCCAPRAGGSRGTDCDVTAGREGTLHNAGNRARALEQPGRAGPLGTASQCTVDPQHTLVGISCTPTSKERKIKSKQQVQKLYPRSREAHDAFFSLQGDALGENRETTLHGLPAVGAILSGPRCGQPASVSPAPRRTCS